MKIFRIKRESLRKWIVTWCKLDCSVYPTLLDSTVDTQSMREILCVSFRLWFNLRVRLIIYESRARVLTKQHLNNDAGGTAGFCTCCCLRSVQLWRIYLLLAEFHVRVRWSYVFDVGVFKAEEEGKNWRIKKEEEESCKVRHKSNESFPLLNSLESEQRENLIKFYFKRPVNVTQEHVSFWAENLKELKEWRMKPQSNPPSQKLRKQ